MLLVQLRRGYHDQAGLSPADDALDTAHTRHPERFPNGPPKAALPPATVHINPLEASTVLVSRAESDGPAANINAPMITTWVDWFNNRRLREPIGYVPPAEFETAFYDKQRDPAMAVGFN